MRASRGSDFDAFVLGRSAALLRSAYLLTGDAQAAEDLLQDVLERVYVAWPRIRRSPEGYVRQALVRHAINRWRGRRRRPETALLDEHDVAAPDLTEKVATHDEIIRALRDLPARQRAAVVLRHVEDLSEAETARLLGCTVGTVKSQTARGLAKLRSALSAVYDPTTLGSGR